jgi:diguanylate cyclase (GGDEF)-like protein
MNSIITENFISVGLEASKILYYRNDDNTVFEKLCHYLYSKFVSSVDYVSVYIINEAETSLLEESVTDEFAVRQGIISLQLNELKDTLQGKKFLVYEKDYGHCLRIPICKDASIIGLIELFNHVGFNMDFINSFLIISDIISLGVHYNITLRKNRILNNKLYLSTDLPKLLQSCNSTLEAMVEYALYVVKSLKFDRVSIFLKEDQFEEEYCNICVNFTGEVFYITDCPKLPEIDTEPVELDNLVGFWFPVISGSRNLGYILYDNIYSSYHLNEWFKDTLTSFTTQFSVAIENMLLLKGIRKIAQTDKLTGTFNRSYFEHILSQIHMKDVLPCSVILGDVNGLKITNDVFGHLLGDKLLKDIAGILNGVIGPKDIVARWGGDEFIVLLPHTDENRAIEICQKIASACENTKGDIKPSISTGHATATSEEINMDELFKRAEDMMYRMKLLDKNSFRNTFITSLQETLHEKCGETSQHLERLFLFSQRVGIRLGLSDTEQSDLKLLAYLHDIGKVAISDMILNKPGKLTSEEWEVMKTHSEVGCRIVQSAPELATISKLVLYHHERWDGRGYPSGLSGNDIPKLSRIISILDTYDVMTSERSYKNAMSHEDAIEELKRCSGTQFDPYLINELCKDGGELFLQ